MFLSAPSLTNLFGQAYRGGMKDKFAKLSSKSGLKQQMMPCCQGSYIIKVQELKKTPNKYFLWIFATTKIFAKKNNNIRQGKQALNVHNR